MTVQTLIEFLCFRGRAIRSVALSSTATWVGCLLVLTAGLAREYDGEYLLAEPWHLLLPLAASLVGCGALTLLVWILTLLAKPPRLSLAKTFLALLNVYWMTAPMAWLYAIPFERWLSPGDATRANLWLLGIVSVWRVALMARALSVLYQVRWLSALVPVMVFSVAMALLALQLIPSPLFMIMGGVRLTESESIILGTRLWITAACVLTGPVWLLVYLVQWGKFPWQPAFCEARQPVPVSGGLVSLLVASWLVWLPILPTTQAEQALRFQAEQAIRGGRFEQLCQLAAAHPAGDFPPHWDPPPRIGYGEQQPNLIDAMQGILQHQAPPWLRAVYEEKLDAYLDQLAAWYSQNSLPSLTDGQLQNLLELVDQTRPEIWQRLPQAIEHELESEDISEQRRALLQQLQESIHGTPPILRAR